MPYILEDLEIDRVDLVDEGANSAAAITLFKRKEKSMEIKEILEKMKPEHAEIVQKELDQLKEQAGKNPEAEEECVKLREANEALTKANKTLTEANASLDAEVKKHKTTPAEPSMEDIMKSASPEVREYLTKLNNQKIAAEEAVRKAADAEKEASAVAKAATLKSVPIEQDKLVEIIKGATPEVLELLEAVSKAMDGFLGEVGKASPGGGGKTPAADAWAKIEQKATELAKSAKISKAKAISQVVDENPELYKEYIEGGAN